MIADPLAAPPWPVLARRVRDAMGLDFGGKRERDLRHAVAALAPELGHAAADACAAHLAKVPWTRELEGRLAAQLTVGESYFFRDPPLIDLLAHRLLPQLAAERRACGDRRLRIWSAGCSRGEEPYTLAIVLRSLLADIDEWDVSILATDINPDVLAKAREGSFGTWSFRGVAAHVRDVWFDRLPGGRWGAAPALRRMIRFEAHNLAQAAGPGGLAPPGGVDVLFCRNVLMYFEPQQARQAALRLAGSLAPGGWLVVSPSEACGMQFPELEPVNFEQGVLLRKPAPGHAAPAGDPPAMQGLPPAQPPLADHPRAGDEDPEGEALRLADAGRFAQALALCERWLQRDRLDPRAHYLRGLILLEAGDAAGARESLRRSLYLDPAFAPAGFALARLEEALP